MAPMGTSRLYRPDPTSVGLDEHWGRATARVTTATDPVVVAIGGEIDASNGVALAGYVERHAGIAATLILDLSAVEFFGTAGLTALRRIDLCCDRIGWMLVPSPAVRRALRACHADDLPQTDSVATAVAALDAYRAVTNSAFRSGQAPTAVSAGCS
jgi:anti-anti-sigma factor